MRQIINWSPQTQQTVADNNKIEQTIILKNPKLWGIENPHLYKARLTLQQNDKIIDEYTQNFGVRTIKFDAETGFTLNGKTVKLKGGCIHHDNGPLGSVAIDRAEERKIELLKQNGYNAVRLAHNPFSSKLLEACDRLGLLVINETFDMWNTHKTPDDYANYFKEWWEKDLTSHILKDINHPSVIMWSIGNEIPEIIDTAGLSNFMEIGKCCASPRSFTTCHQCDSFLFTINERFNMGRYSTCFCKLRRRWL